MELNLVNKSFSDQDKVLRISRNYSHGAHFYAEIVFLSDKFVEYQKDIFSEYLWDIADYLSSVDTLGLLDFRKYYETKLQDLNTKLSIFAQKIQDVERFDIAWIIQVYINETFISSMIGHSSIVIFRENKIHYSVWNEIDTLAKIDLFTDFIEWDVENTDEILTAWIDLMSIFDQQDLQDAIAISANEEKPLLTVLEEICIARIPADQLRFLTHAQISLPTFSVKEDVKEKFIKKMQMVTPFKNILLRHRYPVLISWLVIVVIYLFYVLVSSFNWAWALPGSGGVACANVTIDDLKKDIDVFRKIWSDSDEKAKKYVSINDNISCLERENKWPYDVQDLKKILDNEYYRGFNIVRVDTIVNDRIYSFDDAEKTALWQILRLEYQKSMGYSIAWTDASVLGAYSDTVKWKTVAYNLPTTVAGCSANLIQDWLYCFTADWQVYNVQKWWLKSVSTVSGKFPANLSSVASYWKSNFYTLTSDPELNSKGVYVTRYNNTVWSQEKFGESLNYTLPENLRAEFATWFASWFSSLVVDGSFLLWSKWANVLYQGWREWTSTDLKVRKVPLLGGADLLTPYSSNTFIKTDATSKYVILFDKDSQTVTVYRSTPFKTNTSYSNTYDLRYFFRLKYELGDKSIQDIYVENTDKPMMYYVTQDWVYQTKLYEFIDSFTQTSGQ